MGLAQLVTAVLQIVGFSVTTPALSRTVFGLLIAVGVTSILAGGFLLIIGHLQDSRKREKIAQASPQFSK